MPINPCNQRDACAYLTQIERLERWQRLHPRHFRDAILRHVKTLQSPPLRQLQLEARQAVSFQADVDEAVQRGHALDVVNRTAVRVQRPQVLQAAQLVHGVERGAVRDVERLEVAEVREGGQAAELVVGQRQETERSRQACEIRKCVLCTMKNSRIKR